MLQFILGRAATGRTYYIMEKIKEDIKNNKRIVLLIPEQFSFECEKAILRSFGDESATNVEVLSFSRICDEVNRLAGGNAFTVMSDCDKIITMRMALKAVEKELLVWGKYSGSRQFAATLVETIDELKTCDVSPEQLTCYLSDNSLGRKLGDIIKIYNAYDALIYNRFIDPTDKLTHLYNKLTDFKFFNEKEVYIDSFKDFTGQQYKILERIFSQANNITISLLSDGNDTQKPDVFFNIRKVKEKIESIASKYAVKTAQSVYLEGSRYSSNELKALEKSFCEDFEEFNDETKDIVLYNAENVYDEAEFVAHNIRRLVRTMGYRYGDFVIIARDTADYENAVLMACKKNGVSCFFDKKTTIKNHPVCLFALGALSASNRISTKEIFEYLKTGLSSLDLSDINELENYVNLWNIEGATWLEEWKMNPLGFREDDCKDDKILLKLKKINQIREKALGPIINLKNNFGETAKEHSLALITLFKECNVCDNLINLEECYSLNGEKEGAQFLKQGYEKYVDILDSVVKCLGNAPVSYSDYIDTLSLAISHTTIGTIPQMLDQVTFGAADRIRPSRPKIAFVLGMNQGVFPKIQSTGGVFAAYERKQLIDMGININDNALQQAITENLLVYTSLCCPSDKLFISFCKESLSGEALEPSSAIKKISKVFPNIQKWNFDDSLLLDDNVSETQASLFSDYCDLLGKNKESAKLIREAAKYSPDISLKLDILEQKIKDKQQNLSENAAHRLYGNEIKTSASDFEIFHRCKFAYFCRYGLKLKKIQPASLDVMQRGTIVHYVLEKYISRYGDVLSTMDSDKITNVTSLLMDEYFSLIPGVEQIRTARFNFLSNVITDSVTAVTKQVTRELVQSDFVPKKCELSIGGDGDVPAVDIKIDESSLMRLQGKIDRVDTWNGYIRIVDYKTGVKIFKLPDILCGLNLQMLIYLYALVRGQGSEYQGMEPAGILYMPSSKKLGSEKLSMNGLLVKNEDVLTAMEKENNGDFVPKMKFNKDGTIADSDSFVDSSVFDTVFDYITYLFCRMGEEIRAGDITVLPIDDSKKSACRYCDFAGICHIENTQHQKVEYMDNAQVINIMKGCINNGI